MFIININNLISKEIKYGLTKLYKLFQGHPYHLVDQSPWPFFISWTLFIMMSGAVSKMQGYWIGTTTFYLGLLLTINIMTFWLHDVNIEATYLGHHTKEVKRGLMIGFALFIVSEVFAFASIFWAFFHSAFVPAVELGGQWPPLGVTPLNSYSIPLLNTILLLSSGAYVTYSHHSLIAGIKTKTLISGILTILLAIVFTLFQGFEYFTSSFSIADGVFGSTFFCSTGLHGFHVIVGTLFIFFATLRIYFQHVTKSTHVGVETGIVYWHFVDIVWLFLFIAIYSWGSNSNL
jgi:cytochrome c oxidase subunit 3